MQETNEDQKAFIAMELALRVGELMLAGGESAERVEGAIIRLGRLYGMPRCEPNVTLAAISVSYLPGHGRAPVTGERMVRRRRPDFRRLIAVQELVAEADAGTLTLDEAMERLRRIISEPSPYRPWVVNGAVALIGGAGAVLVSGGPGEAAAAFAATLLGDRTGAWLDRRGVAEFFQVGVGAALGSALAVLLVAAGLPLDDGAVIIGVVIAMIPGRALVAGLQDGIAGDYMTGTVRLVEAFFIIAAILAGVGLTIYSASRIGTPITPEELPYFEIAAGPGPLLAAGVIAASFAVFVLAPRAWVPVAAAGGMVSWFVFVGLLDANVAPAFATLLATTLMGVIGTGYARARGVPHLVAVVPWIVPLMPGTLTYRGLLEVTTDHPARGVLILVEAISSAMALGAGLIIGAEALRAILPVRDRAARVIRPVTRFVRR